MTINTAAKNREDARRTDGTFGHQHRDEPDGDGLAAGAPSQPILTHAPGFMRGCQLQAARVGHLTDCYTTTVDLVAAAEAISESLPQAKTFYLEESDQFADGGHYWVVPLDADGNDLRDEAGSWDVPDVRWPYHVTPSSLLGGGRAVTVEDSFSVAELRQSDMVAIQAEYEEETFEALFLSKGGPGGSIRKAAAVSGVAVAYQDRGTFESYLNRDLTDKEWERIKPHLDGYDEWLDNSGASMSIVYWRDEVLREAGIGEWGF